MSMTRTSDGIENKHDVYRGEYRMKTFCESFREHTMKIQFENNKMALLTKEQQEFAAFAKIVCT